MRSHFVMPMFAAARDEYLDIFVPQSSLDKIYNKMTFSIYIKLQKVTISVFFSLSLSLFTVYTIVNSQIERVYIIGKILTLPT